jgi:hypothetical protein
MNVEIVSIDDLAALDELIKRWNEKLEESA